MGYILIFGAIWMYGAGACSLWLMLALGATVSLSRPLIVLVAIVGSLAWPIVALGKWMARDE